MVCFTGSWLIRPRNSASLGSSKRSALSLRNYVSSFLSLASTLRVAQQVAVDGRAVVGSRTILREPFNLKCEAGFVSFEQLAIFCTSTNQKRRFFTTTLFHQLTALFAVVVLLTHSNHRRRSEDLPPRLYQPRERETLLPPKTNTNEDTSLHHHEPNLDRTPPLPRFDLCLPDPVFFNTSTDGAGSPQAPASRVRAVPEGSPRYGWGGDYC